MPKVIQGSVPGTETVNIRLGSGYLILAAKSFRYRQYLSPKGRTWGSATSTPARLQSHRVFCKSKIFMLT